MRMITRSEQVAAVPTGNLIQVVRASYGMNCNPRSATARVPRNAPAGKFEFDSDSESKLYWDNARETVAPRCQGKPACQVTNTPAAVGFDPAPACFEKELVVEYRCYSFDRLWKLVVPPSEKGDIDCSKVEQPH